MEAPKVSPRAATAARIARWLSARVDRTFTAPYGVIEGFYIPKHGAGKARRLTFGIARTLDATLDVWTPTRLELLTSRDEYVRFDSEQEFYDYAIEHYGAREDEA